MLPSVRAFFTGILDYAGLFPPAQLPLDEAVRNYTRYRTEPESWLLGRFVCPVSKLAALGERSHGEPIPISVLLGFNDNGQLLKEFCSANEAITACQELHRARTEISAAEVRLGPFSSPVPTDFHLKIVRVTGLADRVTPYGLPLKNSFYEYDPVDEWSVRVTKFVNWLSRHDAQHRLGFKLRCGGANASAVPSVEQVAHVIAACRDAGVPLKFTAGLHHPLRHDDHALQTKLHGFLNVFAAGVLAHARTLNEEQLCEIIADEDAGHFTFAEGGFAWKDHCASVEEIAATRQHGLVSFGSCSFEEPRDDLRSMGLI